MSSDGSKKRKSSAESKATDDSRERKNKMKSQNMSADGSNKRKSSAESKATDDSRERKNKMKNQNMSADGSKKRKSSAESIATSDSRERKISDECQNCKNKSEKIKELEAENKELRLKLNVTGKLNKNNTVSEDEQDRKMAEIATERARSLEECSSQYTRNTAYADDVNEHTDSGHDEVDNNY